MIRLTPLLATLACAGTDPSPCGGPPPGPDQPGIVASTPTDTFDAGTLTVVDRRTGEVCDGVVTATGDTVLRSLGETLVQIDRLRHDRLRWLRPDDWHAPVREFSVGEGTNPHDVVRCGDAWLVSLYERAALGVFDDEGRRLAEVDLTDLADGDGLPEASDLWTDGERALVALQRLDRGGVGRWPPSGPGRIAAVDCATWTVEEAWNAPPNARLADGPDGLPIVHGEDGRIAPVDPLTGPGPTLATSERPVVSAAFTTDGHGLLVTRDAALWHRLSCVDPDGRITPLRLTDAYLPDLQPDLDGDVWVAVRPGWKPSDAEVPDAPETVISPPVGLWRVDPVACEVVEEIATALGPFDLAAY